MSIFEVLDSHIQKALKELGIKTPSEAQKEVMPKIMDGKNILLVAPTGIGKTEAAILPIFDDILKNDPDGFYVIYVTPLRALNRDMMKRMSWFGDRLGITVGVRHGDTTTSERRKQALKPPQILITTPETFQIMMTGKRLAQHLKNVHWVVIDEIHEMAQDERGAQLSVGLERLKALTGRNIRRIGLSATIGSPEEVSKFLKGSTKKIEIVNIAERKRMQIQITSPSPNKEDEVIAEKVKADAELAARLRRCRDIISKHKSTLFFVNTRDAAEILATRFRLLDPDFPIGVHHGSLSKYVRIQMEDEFKSQMLKGLICTSSLELGIDVGSADYSIQYNSPRQVSRLVQRVGRAGHMIGEISKGMMITDHADDILEGMVIARRALAHELEDTRIRENPLSVLANQVVAQLMQSGEISTKDFYKTLKKAYPFRNLDYEVYIKVIDQLNDLRIIWKNEEMMTRSRNSRTHFLDNISMIPDERSYRVVDITTRKSIGKLDESFVVAYAEPNAPLIISGRPWRIIELADESIIVEPSGELGAIPSWVGEEIPVPYSVAQEVGRFRDARDFTEYPVDSLARKKVNDELESQDKKHPMPTDRQITLEIGDRLIIINACCGTKVNETLGKLISALLMARLGESVAVSSDPYRIILQLPRGVKVELIEDILKKTDPDNLEVLLRLYLRRTSYLKWKFIHVAKKFGAVKKDADYRNINIERVMETFEGTPLMNEALKMLWENLDIPKAMEVLQNIQKEKIKLEICSLSPIGRAGLEARMDLMVPQRPTHAILQALKARLERERVVAVCMNCHSKITRSVKSLPTRISCNSCGAVMMAIVRRNEVSKLGMLKKQAPSKEEKKAIKKLMKAANLLNTHGKKAVLALAARGVGPDVAGKILSRLFDDEDEFLAAILTAEINYARTRRFWD